MKRMGCYEELKVKVSRDFAAHFYRNRFVRYRGRVANVGIFTCLHVEKGSSPWWYAYVYECATDKVLYSGALADFEWCPSLNQANEMIDCIISKMSMR